MLPSLPFNQVFSHAGEGRKWFEINNSAEGAVEINLTDEIGVWGTRARWLVDAIKNLDENTTLKVHIYSPGGDVLEGNEIHNAIKAHKGKVEITIGALCASIATVIACAGPKGSVSMAKNGLYMVHNPWVVAYGESKDLVRMAGVMDRMKGNILDTYAERTGLPKEELAKMMDEETWMTAEEAKAKGFIDIVLDVEDKDDVQDRFDLSRFRNSAAISRLLPGKMAMKKPAGGGDTEGEREQPSKPKQTPAPASGSNLLDAYMKNQFRVFASLAALTAAARFYSDRDTGGTFGGSPLGRVMGNTPPAPPVPDEEAAKKLARDLYQAKLKRDKEIDDIVVAVRNRDKKDFTKLAAKYKEQDKTPDEFARAIATSDEFESAGVVGSGIEVVGVSGLPKGSPGEVFVASDTYKSIADRLKRGSRTRAEVTVETMEFAAAALAGFMNVTTSTGLTSIEKLPGVVTLGVRPLMVKDLIAPGATNSTTIRYIQERTFANGAGMVAEGAAKPAATFDLVEVDANVKKIAVWTKVTDELFADFLAVASYINQRLPYMVERTEEDQLLNGDGTGQNLTGILATNGIQTQAKGVDAVVDAIYRAMTKVRWGNLAGAAQGGFEPDGIVVHPTDWETIRLTKDANGQYLGGGPFTGAYGNGGLVQFDTLWGKPVAVTPAIALGTALVGAFRLASQYFQRQGMMIESTNTDQDDFIKNLTTIRAETRLTLAVYRPLAFCKVTGLNA